MKTVNRITNLMEVYELREHMGEIVQIQGSIYKIRRMKGFSFVLLRTKRDVVQCVAEGDLPIPQEESCVVMTAEVVEEKRSRIGYELHIQDMEILSTPKEKSPIVINQKLVNTSLEHLLDCRPITLRNEKQRAIFKLQEGICRGFREFLIVKILLRFTHLKLCRLVQKAELIFLNWIILGRKRIWHKVRNFTNR